MMTGNISASSSESQTSAFLQSSDANTCGDVLAGKLCIDPSADCSQTMRGSGQNIFKSVRPPNDLSKLSTNSFCYVPVTEDESDELQRKYGELSGEIVIVEITIKDIQGLLSQQPTTPQSLPTIPTISLQKSTSYPNPIALNSLGISLCGNKDLNQMAVLVCGIRPRSIAKADGRIAVGDQILELNEHILYGRSHLNAGPLILSCLLSVLRRHANKRSKSNASLRFVIWRNLENLTNMAVGPLSYFTNSEQTRLGTSADEAGWVDSASKSPFQVRGSLTGRSTFEEVHVTCLQRGRKGFGFAIMNKSFTNEPGIYIKQLIENSPAAMDGTLRAGDRILRIDWHDAAHAGYDSVLEWLRSARHQVRIVISRVRLFTAESQPSEDEEPYKMGLGKRLSAPLISSLIHAFTHNSSSSTLSKKSSHQLSPMDGSLSSSNDEPQASKQSTVSEPFDCYSPAVKALKKLRRASCPDVMNPGGTKPPPPKHVMGEMELARPPQLASPPIPVLPLEAVSRDDLGGGSNGGLYEESLKKLFAASFHDRRKHHESINCDKAESVTARPIYPGQKTLIYIRKNAALSLGISLIGGRETSLGVLQVHEIFPEGAIAIDGRLRQGDRLLAVNDESLSNLPYALAVSILAAAFSSQTPIADEVDPARGVKAISPAHDTSDSDHIALLVDRPGAGVQTKWYDQEVIVSLYKKPGRGLGLCITERSGSKPVAVNGNTPPSIDPSKTQLMSPVLSITSQRLSKATRNAGLGIIICDLIKGSAAQLDGRIMIGDQILAINEVEIEHSSHEEVATLLKTSLGTVSLRLGRLKNQPTALSSVAVAFRAEQ